VGLDQDRIVEVACVLAVDGDDGEVAEIEPTLAAEAGTVFGMRGAAARPRCGNSCGRSY
jgi:hypothetical protein